MAGFPYSILNDSQDQLPEADSSLEEDKRKRTEAEDKLREAEIRIQSLLEENVRLRQDPAHINLSSLTSDVKQLRRLLAEEIKRNEDYRSHNDEEARSLAGRVKSLEDQKGGVHEEAYKKLNSATSSTTQPPLPDRNGDQLKRTPSDDWSLLEAPPRKKSRAAPDGTDSAAKGPAPTPPAPIVEIPPVLAVLAATQRPLSDSPYWKSQPNLPEEMGLKKIETRYKTDWPEPLLYDPPRRVDETNTETLAKYAELDKLWDAWLDKEEFSREGVQKLYNNVKKLAKYEGLGWFTNLTMFRVPRLPTDALKLVYLFAEIETNYRKAITEAERQRKKRKG